MVVFSFIERVIEVAPGSDVSERCETDSWDRTSADAVELKLNNTAYLLVQNFQQKGLYRCSSKEITLEKKHGKTATHTHTQTCTLADIVIH